MNCISFSDCKALLEKSWRVFDLFSFSLKAVLREIQDEADVAKPISTTQCNPSQLSIMTRKKYKGTL